MPPSEQPSALHTDHYELTMVDAALRSGVAERRAVFEVFARALPPGRRYGVVGGTDRFLDALDAFRFTDRDLGWLADRGFLSEAALERLAHLRFTGHVEAARSELRAEQRALDPGSPPWWPGPMPRGRWPDHPPPGDSVPTMATFLSPEWIDELDAATSASTGLRQATAELELTVQQVVVPSDNGADAGDGTSSEETAWYVVVDHGSVRVHRGRAAHADITFTQDRTTATAVGRGELSAQAAFMLGRLRVGGDVSLLMAHQPTFAGLDDVFAGVRSRTTYRG